MNTFNDIEFLWKTSIPIEVPNVDKIINKAAKDNKSIVNKILLQVLLMSLAFINIVWVGYFFEFQYISSYIGMALMLVCIAVFSILRFKQARFLQKVDFTISPAILLKKYEAFHQHQKWLNTVGTRWYTILLNIAFGFYFYEMIYKAPLSLTVKIIILCVYIAWMLIATLWIGKKSICKEHERINDIIKKIKEMQEGFSA